MDLTNIGPPLINGIGRLMLKVRDLEASDRFYRTLLGLRLVETLPGMRLYSTGAHYCDIELIEVGPDAPASHVRSIGMFQFCLSVRDRYALESLRQRCRFVGLSVFESSNHKESCGFYTSDPDGNFVEMAVDVSDARYQLNLL